MNIKTKFLLVAVGLCFVSSSFLFALDNKADEALSKGKKLYADGKYEEAMDSFVDVFISGNPDQVAEANEYMNLIHFERGGVVPPKQVPYDKEIEDRQNIGVQGKNLYDNNSKKDKTEKQPKEDTKKYKEVPVKEKTAPDVKEPLKSVPEADPFAQKEEPAKTAKDTKTGTKNTAASKTNKGTKTGAAVKTNKGTNAKSSNQQKTNKSGTKNANTSAKSGTKTAAGVTTKGGTKNAAKPQKYPKSTSSTPATTRNADTTTVAAAAPQVAATTPQETNTPAQADTTPQGSVVTVQVADNEPQDSVVTVQVTKTTPPEDAAQGTEATPQDATAAQAPVENQDPATAVVPAVVVGAEATPDTKGAEATTAPQQDANTAAQPVAEEPKTAVETKEAAPVTKTTAAAPATTSNAGKVKTAVTKPQAHSNLSEKELKAMAKAEAKAKKKQEKAAAKAKRKQEKAEAKARKKQAKAEAKARKQKEKELDKAKRKDIVIPEELVVDNKETTPKASKYTLRNRQREKENEQRQKMREELLIKLRKNQDVQVYMRDGKIDAIDIPSDILFRNRTINKDAKEMMDYVYGLMIVENPPAYYILPEGSFTDDVTVQNVRQAVALNSYLINRGISPGKLNLNMGLSTQEPPEKFRNLAGTSIIFDYDGKTRSKATKLQEKRNLPPALSMAVAPFEEIIPTWDEAFLIDFSVMETAAPIKKWTLQIISHDIDGHFYVIKQYSGKNAIAKQVFWNGKKRYFGQPLPTGNYTAVLWAVDSENRERLVKRKLVLSEAPRKFYDEDEKTEPEVIQEENKEQVKKAVKAKSVTLNYKQKRLWKKPGKKMPPAPKVEEKQEDATAEQERAQAASSAGFYDEEYGY